MLNVEHCSRQIKLSTFRILIKRFLQGWVNISITGVSGNAHVALNYENLSQNVAPKVDMIDLSFQEIDVNI